MALAPLRSSIAPCTMSEDFMLFELYVDGSWLHGMCGPRGPLARASNALGKAFTPDFAKLVDVLAEQVASRAVGGEPVTGPGSLGFYASGFLDPSPMPWRNPEAVKRARREQTACLRFSESAERAGFALFCEQTETASLRHVTEFVDYRMQIRNYDTGLAIGIVNGIRRWPERLHVVVARPSDYEPSVAGVRRETGASLVFVTATPVFDDEVPSTASRRGVRGPADPIDLEPLVRRFASSRPAPVR